MKLLRRFLLWLLDSTLTDIPCHYALINNVDAWDTHSLEMEEKTQPGITVTELLRSAAAFRSCPMRKDGGVTVIEADGTHHDADVWNMHALRNLGTEPSHPPDEKRAATTGAGRDAPDSGRAKGEA
jgi:hypothetical protein